MPPSKSRANHWRLSELLGQRKLLGFGALVAWLILFHLLVNVWLLCIFTSFLVVLGGWLGSRAALDANSLLHLEHFLPLCGVQPRPHSPESEWRLDHEIHNAVHKAMRDFVSSWYRTLLEEEEGEFERVARDSMLESVMDLKERARRVDRKALVKRALELYGGHLQSYMTAREVQAEAGLSRSLWELYSQADAPHPALSSAATELSYSRALVNVVLNVLVPYPNMESRTGGHMVAELITCNVLLPLVSRVSDPDWLNQTIVDIFTKAREPPESHVDDLSGAPLYRGQVPTSLEPLCAEDDLSGAPLYGGQVPTSLEPLCVEDDLSGAPLYGGQVPTSLEPLCAEDDLSGAPLYRGQVPRESWATCRSASSDGPGFTGTSLSHLAELHSQGQTLTTEPSQDSMVSLTSVGVGHVGLPSPPRANCFYQTPESDPERLSPESKKLSSDSLLPADSEDDQADGFCACAPPTFCVGMSFLDEPSGCFGPLRARGHKVGAYQESQWPAGMAQEGALACPPRGLLLRPYGLDPPLACPPRGLSLLPYILESPPAGPRRGLCLPPYGLELPHSSIAPVGIRNVRIAGTVTSKDHRGTSTHPYTLYVIKYDTVVDLQLVASHTVNRRYSEFLNLQTRLEENPELRKIIKNIKGPKRLFPDLSFGNTDLEKAEARRVQLDTFLKQLSSVPEAAGSEDMQEFLSLNAEGCLSFEKKPFASRLDKMVGNALDTLKTAFPRSEPASPTDDLDGDADGRAADSRRLRSRLRFPSKIAPSLNIPDLQPKVTYCFGEGSPVLSGMSVSGLEGFVREQERLLQGTVGRDAGGARRRREQPGKDKKTSGKPRGTDTAVADVALNILCLVMREHWSWLCTENIQKTIRLLFGTFIERWLDEGVAHLTSAPCWVIYMQVMQEAVWPGGVLPVHPRPERSATQRQETKEQCLDCLMQLLPELITDLLGAEKYRLSLETMLESLQDHHINKHLVYCVCDLLLEFLIPESSDEGFQRALLLCLARDVVPVQRKASVANRLHQTTTPKTLQ